MITIVLGFLSGEMVVERDREGEHEDIVRRYVLSALPQLQSEQRRTA